MDAKELSDVFVKEYHHHSKLLGAAPTTTSLVDFCSIWPMAKQGVSLVAGIISWIPGVPHAASVAAALQALLKVGDEISSQVCATQASSTQPPAGQ